MPERLLPGACFSAGSCSILGAKCVGNISLMSQEEVHAMQVELRTQIMLARQAEKQDKARQLQQDSGPGERGQKMTTKPLSRRLRYALSRAGSRFE